MATATLHRDAYYLSWPDGYPIAAVIKITCPFPPSKWLWVCVNVSYCLSSSFAEVIPGRVSFCLGWQLVMRLTARPCIVLVNHSQWEPWFDAWGPNVHLFTYSGACTTRQDPTRQLGWYWPVIRDRSNNISDMSEAPSGHKMKQQPSILLQRGQVRAKAFDLAMVAVSARRFLQKILSNLAMLEEFCFS